MTREERAVQAVDDALKLIAKKEGCSESAVWALLRSRDPQVTNQFAALVAASVKGA